MISKRWTWLTAFALLFAGVTNAHSHIHYCFDGRAPAAAILHVDASDHAHAIPTHHARDLEDADDNHDTSHDDLDLDVPNDALAKSFKYDLSAVVAATLRTGELASTLGSASAAPRDVVPAPNPPHSRPQPRGPPR